MDWICDRIAVGSYVDTFDMSNMAKIDFAINMAEEIPTPPNVPSIKYGIPDNEPIPRGVIPRVTTEIREKVSKGQRVLVHCNHGQSRSVAMVAAYLHECGFSIPEALKFIKGRHAESNPHESLINSVKMYYLVEKKK